jgi:Protein of unknown function (DUF3592)
MRSTSDLYWTAGLVIVGLLALYEVRRLLILRSTVRRWPTVKGEVLVSRLDINDSEDPTVCRPYVKYRYTVKDVDYTHDRYQLIDSLSNHTEREARKLLGYEVGASVPVYYNPIDPADAVLKAQVSRSRLGWALVGGVMFIVGGVAYSAV